MILTLRFKIGGQQRLGTDLFGVHAHVSHIYIDVHIYLHKYICCVHAYIYIHMYMYTQYTGAAPISILLVALKTQGIVDVTSGSGATAIFLVFVFATARKLRLCRV